MGADPCRTCARLQQVSPRGIEPADQVTLPRLAAIRSCKAGAPDLLGRDECLHDRAAAWQPYTPAGGRSHQPRQHPLLAKPEHPRGPHDHDLEILRGFEKPALLVQLEALV